MKIKIKFIANTAILMKRKEMEIKLPINKDYTIKDIIKEILRITKINIKGMVIENNWASKNKILINLNGKDINHLDGTRTIVNDGDIITMSPLNLLG